MKHIKLFVTLALLAALSVFASAWVDTFTISRIDDVDYGNHSRLYFSINYAGYYPFTWQAAIRIYWAKDHAIGNELPQFDNMSLYVPTAGYYWDRVFWIAKPAGLDGTWNLRVDIEDSTQSKIATSNEFSWEFGGGGGTEPATYAGDIDWIADDEGLGWSTFFIITNLGDVTATFDLDTYYSFTGGFNAHEKYLIAPRACTAIDTNAVPALQNRFLNALVTSPQPFAVLVYCLHESGLSFQYRVEGK